MVRTLTAQIMLANLSPHLPSSLLFLAGYPYFVPTFNFHFIDCGFKMLLLLVVLFFGFFFPPLETQPQSDLELAT